jgi:hypothetical protein
MFDLVFALKAFVFLGIERFLCGYWYTFPQKFEKQIRDGNFGGRLQAEPRLWKCAMKLKMYIKVFQFSVIGFDLLLRCDLTNPISSQEATCKAIGGVVLIVIGWGLNYAVFKALKPIGVYYGYEFGYDVPRVNCFPYNTSISHPQYWGVVLCIWGIYLALGASSLIVPVLETFWYMMSMKVLENPRGRVLASALIGEDYTKKD